MTQRLLTRDEATERLASVFRTHGFAGASLTRLSDATGLGKSSLYHYFPKGKDDMAAAVLDLVSRRYNELVLGPLRSAGRPHERVQRMVNGLADFYDSGNMSCLLNLFGIGDARAIFHEHLAARVQTIEAALSQFLGELGLDQEAARSRAEQTLISLEGALVLARASGSSEPFRRVLANLPKSLLDP